MGKEAAPAGNKNNPAAKLKEIAFPRVGTGWHCVPRKVRFSVWLFSKTKRCYLSVFFIGTTLQPKQSPPIVVIAGFVQRYEK